MSQDKDSTLTTLEKQQDEKHARMLRRYYNEIEGIVEFVAAPEASPTALIDLRPHSRPYGKKHRIALRNGRP